MRLNEESIELKNYHASREDYITMKILLVCLFIIFGTNLIAQDISIKIIGSNGVATLLQLEGENSTKIDSVVSRNGVYKFSLNGKHNGFYRLQLDKQHWIDFINDGANIKIESDIKNIIDNLKIIQSETNKLYHQFIGLNKSYKTKTELLNVVLTHYPKDDSYYSLTERKLIEIQEEYKQFVEVTSQEKENSFISRYIKSAQLPIVPILPEKITSPNQPNKQLEYLKLHALDNVDFTDIEMLYSDLYTTKSIEYLTYYRNQQLPKPLLEKEFMKAVDTLLYKAKANELVYKHMTEYLIDGFTKFGFDLIINYIVDNYVIKDDICLNAELESSIQKRIDQAKRFKIGSDVPNIILPDINGNEIDLSKIESEKVLVLFYASWCPHCIDKLPELVTLYNNQKEKRVEVLAISIDEKKEEWTKVIKDYKMNWLNASDLKGWSGKAAEDYSIYATPTMFLLDKNKKVESTPLEIEEIRGLFN